MKLFAYLTVILLITFGLTKSCDTDPGCKNCTLFFILVFGGSLIFYQCQQCYDNHTLNQDSGVCNCNPGYYIQPTNSSICTKCNPLCTTCLDGSSCLTCDAQYNRYLNGGQCVCIDGFQQKNGNLGCTKKSNILTVILSSLGGVLILLITVCICYKFCVMRRQQNQQIYDISQNNHVSHQVQIQYNDSYSQNQGNTANSLWNTKQYVYKPGQLCSICIDTQPLYMTDCGHYFHSKCIFQWLNQHSACPNCNKQTNSRQIKIWCYRCKNVLMPVIRTVSMKKSKGKRQLAISGPILKQICQGCQNQMGKQEKKQLFR